MKEINVKNIENVVRDLCIKANIFLPESLKNCIKASTAKEESQTGIEVLGDIRRNFEVAESESLPVCQDTGMAVVFLEIGILGKPEI